MGRLMYCCNKQRFTRVDLHFTFFFFNNAPTPGACQVFLTYVCNLPDFSVVLKTVIIYHVLLRSAVSTATDIHASVFVHYMMYSGRSENRDGSSPETVESDTGLGLSDVDPVAGGVSFLLPIL
jgi:hypothetical protein